MRWLVLGYRVGLFVIGIRHETGGLEYSALYLVLWLFGLSPMTSVPQ